MAPFPTTSYDSTVASAVSLLGFMYSSCSSPFGSAGHQQTCVETCVLCSYCAGPPRVQHEYVLLHTVCQRQTAAVILSQPLLMLIADGGQAACQGVATAPHPPFTRNVVGLPCGHKQQSRVNLDIMQGRSLTSQTQARQQCSGVQPVCQHSAHLLQCQFAQRSLGPVLQALC